MPHAIADVADVTEAYPQLKTHRKQKGRSLPREVQQLSTSLEYLRTLYDQSQLSQSISRQLQAVTRRRATPVTSVLSLGLGSLFVGKDRIRRLKQLIILLAIRENLQKSLGTAIEVFAQDPTFVRADESFLTSLGISISRTSSGSSLGEAASVINESTLLYTPFLTLEIYEQLLITPQVSVSHIFGDDFNTLLSKWPKHSAEHRQVNIVVKSGLSRYRRGAISGEGFWTQEDASFPMALYDHLDQKREVKAKM